MVSLRVRKLKEFDINHCVSFSKREEKVRNGITFSITKACESESILRRVNLHSRVLLKNKNKKKKEKQRLPERSNTKLSLLSTTLLDGCNNILNSQIMTQKGDEKNTKKKKKLTDKMQIRK